MDPPHPIRRPRPRSSPGASPKNRVPAGLAKAPDLRHGICSLARERRDDGLMMKLRLRQIALSPALHAWALACPEGTFAGTCRVETQHATYLFRNGSCFAVSGRGARGGTTSGELVGMKLAGWLLQDESRASLAAENEPFGALAVRVSRTFRPAARAVLVGRDTQDGVPRVALTSSVSSFAQYTDAPPPRMRPPAVSSSGTGSHTRIGLVVPAA